MKALGKVLLLLFGVGIVMVVGGGVAGYVWFENNAEDLKRQGEVAMGEGAAYGETHDANACIDRSLVRLDTCTELVCEVMAKFYLRACLARATGAAELCDGVPERGEIMASAEWAVAACRARATASAECQHILDGCDSGRSDPETCTTLAAPCRRARVAQTPECGRVIGAVQEHCAEGPVDPVGSEPESTPTGQ